MKNKKIVITVLLVVILLFVLATAALAALYFATDIFKTNEKIFWKYFSENSKIMSILSNENTEKQNQLKEQNSYTTAGNLTISAQIGVSDPAKINIATSSIHNKNTGRTYADATLKKEDNDLLKVSYINSGNVYSIKCEDIYQYYIGFRNENLKQLFTNWGLPEEQIASIPDSIDFTSLNSLFELTNEQKKHISETYSNVILQTIPKESYQKLGKETITINGTNYEANKYSLILNINTIKQIVTNILATLQNDTTTLEIINNYINNIILPLNQEQTNDIPDAQTIVNQLFENISSKPDSENEELALTISIYEKNGKTLRTVINDLEEDIIIDLSDEKFSLLIPTSQSMYYNQDYGYDQSEYNQDYEYDQSEYNQDYEYDQSEYNQDEMLNTNNKFMQIVFSKASQKNITNSITIMPDMNNTEETITLSSTIGNIQNGTANNSYYININTISNDAKTTIEIAYDTQIATTSHPEEIIELKDDNSIIINNYPLEQLTQFFNMLSGKASEVFNNVAQELQSEFNAIMSSYSTQNSIIDTALEASQNAEESLKIENLVQSIIAQSKIQVAIKTSEGQDLTDKYELLKIIQSNVPEDYYITSSDNIEFDSSNQKIIGTIVVTNQDGEIYLIDFTNETVTKQN